MKFFNFVVLLGLIYSSQAAEPLYDLVLRKGRIIDGAANPAYQADLAVRGGRIVRIGKFSEKGSNELDASGWTIAPGFIDVHTHAEDVLEQPLAENFLRMGVTTIVLGNCGSSAADLAEYFSRVESTNVSPNVASLIGQGTVRGKVMGGSFMRPPSADELEKMRAMVAKAMRDGAVGLSTGLIYLPGTFAKTDEIVALARVASEANGIYVSHMRDEGLEIFTALEELFQIAREASIRAEVSHIKISSRRNWGRASEVIAAIEKARLEGLEITHDQYMYTASSTGISQLVPEWAREGGRSKFQQRLDDPAEKEKIITEMKEKLKRNGREDFSYAVIADYKADPSLNGSNLKQAAGTVKSSESLDAQIELILEIETKGGANGIFHGIDEPDLRSFLAHPNTMFASDSGVRKFKEGIPHPRGYGNNARVLGRYVRELKLLRMEEAVRRMTLLPATTFRLPDRGQIREGAFADLVVFDPAKIQDNARFDDPHHYATGFKYVLVNGVVVVKDDEHTGARPGKVVRRAP